MSGEYSASLFYFEFYDNRTKLMTVRAMGKDPIRTIIYPFRMGKLHDLIFQVILDDSPAKEPLMILYENGNETSNAVIKMNGQTLHQGSIFHIIAKNYTIDPITISRYRKGVLTSAIISSYGILQIPTVFSNLDLKPHPQSIHSTFTIEPTLSPSYSKTGDLIIFNTNTTINYSQILPEYEGIIGLQPTEISIPNDSPKIHLNSETPNKFMGDFQHTISSEDKKLNDFYTYMKSSFSTSNIERTIKYEFEWNSYSEYIEPPFLHGNNILITSEGEKILKNIEDRGTGLQLLTQTGEWIDCFRIYKHVSPKPFECYFYLQDSLQYGIPNADFIITKKHPLYDPRSSSETTPSAEKYSPVQKIIRPEGETWHTIITQVKSFVKVCQIYVRTWTPEEFEQIYSNVEFE